MLNAIQARESPHHKKKSFYWKWTEDGSIFSLLGKGEIKHVDIKQLEQIHKVSDRCRD